jgi:hypothetical protein
VAMPDGSLRRATIVTWRGTSTSCSNIVTFGGEDFRARHHNGGRAYARGQCVERHVATLPAGSSPVFEARSAQRQRRGRGRQAAVVWQLNRRANQLAHY